MRHPAFQQRAPKAARAFVPRRPLQATAIKSLMCRFAITSALARRVWLTAIESETPLVAITAGHVAAVAMSRRWP